jgi:hypothetical protein
VRALGVNVNLAPAPRALDPNNVTVATVPYREPSIADVWGMAPFLFAVLCMVVITCAMAFGFSRPAAAQVADETYSLTFTTADSRDAADIACVAHVERRGDWYSARMFDLRTGAVSSLRGYYATDDAALDAAAREIGSDC